MNDGKAERNKIKSIAPDFDTSALICCYQKTDPQDFCEALHSISKLGEWLKEIVLIVDGPIQPSVEKNIDEFKFSSFKVYRISENKGLGYALNFGVRMCTNKWILRMDDDDICYSDRLIKQLKFLEKNPKVDVLGGVIREFGESGEYLGYRICPRDDINIKKRLAFRNPVNHVTVLMRREAVLEAGNYSAQIDGYEDYCLWVRMASHGFVFANLSDVLVDVRFTEKQLSRRGGFASIPSEIKMQKILYQHNISSKLQFIFNVLFKVSARLLPQFILNIIFKLFLRKRHI